RGVDHLRHVPRRGPPHDARANPPGGEEWRPQRPFPARRLTAARIIRIVQLRLKLQNTPVTAVSQSSVRCVMNLSLQGNPPAVCPESSSPIELVAADIAEVERIFAEAVGSPRPHVAGLIAHLGNYRGKRLRP